MTAPTPGLKEIVAERFEHWCSLGCSTAPIDRAAASAVIGALYAAIGQPRPKVLFFSSPQMCLLAMKVLFAGHRPRPLWRRLRMQLWHQFEAQLWAPVGEWRNELGVLPGLRGRVSLLQSRLGEQLRDLLAQTLRRAPARRLRRRLLIQLETELAGAVAAGTREPASAVAASGAALADWIRTQPGDLVDQLTGEPVDFERIERQLATRKPLENVCTGPWWQHWLFLFDCLLRAGAACPPQLRSLLQLWLAQSEHCHWWFPYRGIVLASERPCAIQWDSAGRLHAQGSAAVEYRDGFGVHAWHGVVVEPHVITNPGAITVEEVEKESNAEVRRILIERYGWTRYIRDCGAEVIDSVPEDHPLAGLRGARLLRKELEDEPEPIIYLEMVNSTAEPDGGPRRYLERIDPKAYGGDAGRLCHAAMASRWRYRDEEGRLQYTFERWQDYEPTAES